MKRIDLEIERYDWTAIICFSVSVKDKKDLEDTLDEINCPDALTEHIIKNLESGELNTGFTYTNYQERETIVVVCITTSTSEFLNSWSHECRHLVDQISKANGLQLDSEDSAYLCGDINGSLWYDIQERVN